MASFCFDMIDETDTLLAHAADLAARAERGEPCYTAFLTPREQHLIKEKLRTPLFFFGGYAEAERQRAYFLPPYLEGLEEELRAECLAPTLRESITPLRVRGSGYRSLSHRDYLGAVLHLGLDRSRIGDIVPEDEHSAILFADTLLCDFLTENLTRIASDAVHTAPIVLPPDFSGPRRYQPVSDTVASPRADAVVAALCNLPRARAQELFLRGLVEMDYEPLTHPDRAVPEGAVLTVRGFGKFTVRTLSDKTRKGRYRLLADRYV